MHVFLLSLLLSLSAGAQHAEQPQKESDSDLRSAMVIFRMEDVKKGRSIWVERTPGLDHFLRLKEAGKEEKIQKMDSKEAKKLEMEFASKFLRCQYEIEEVPGDCKVAFRLVLKGEGQDICLKDEKKSQEIGAFIQTLNGRF